MRQPHSTARPAGFSLVEVMVALIVISVGLLGVAKMQALALSNTSSAKVRSLAAIEAASLASAMHADRAYWGTLTVPTSMTVTGGGLTSITDANLSGAIAAETNTSCNFGGAAPCIPVNLAAVDLINWATDMGNLLPTSQTAISCQNTLPVICQIQISWVENQVSISGAGASPNLQNSTGTRAYVLTVQP